ncbi:hypothetical protein MA16_Dca018009 [Dendrobium catenatum]|uniref:Uncharacterized protein n=1 Tax=Dendrobium catenatum TaxID=906689 RepID=A0A2I0WPC6_9ASPA|nr:hypothetical protein MA16_Dca018009 [Dendrobium catenatum]
MERQITVCRSSIIPTKRQFLRHFMSDEQFDTNIDVARTVHLRHFLVSIELAEEARERRERPLRGKNGVRFEMNHDIF